jgi:superfamily II DNA or RNA helicase
VHTDARAAQKLRAFGKGRERWIVAVNMVSEGVDIPRLRVGVYATAAKTPLIFRQIVGRFVRTLAGDADMSYLFLPADRLLRLHAAEVEEELHHVLKQADEIDGCELDELREARLETEPDAPDAFVPLAADVAPQLALFGGGPPPPAVKPVAFAGAVARPPGEEEQPPEPAFKRRARLRDKRHGLVKTLAGFNGSSHREVNAWLNRASGVRSVGDASIEQLERSIELAHAELDRLSRRRAS